MGRRSCSLFRLFICLLSKQNLRSYFGLLNYYAQTIFFCGKMMRTLDSPRNPNPAQATPHEPHLLLQNYPNFLSDHISDDSNQTQFRNSNSILNQTILSSPHLLLYNFTIPLNYQSEYILGAVYSLKSDNFPVRNSFKHSGYPPLQSSFFSLSSTLPNHLLSVFSTKAKDDFVAWAELQFCHKVNSIQQFVKVQFMTFSKKNNTNVVKITARKPKYDFISLEKRKRLISLVTEGQLSIYRASRETGINNATAKVILKRYRSQGSIFIRKCQKSPTHEGVEEKQVEQVQIMANQQAQISTNNQPLFHPQSQLIYTTLPCYLYQAFYYSPNFF